MNHIMVVCDEEEEYATRLSDYLNMKEGFPFDVRHFSSPQKMAAFSQNQNVEVALISEKAYECVKREGRVDQIILLNETGTIVEGASESIYKYQSCENMIKEVLRLIVGSHKGSNIVTRKKGMEMIGLYTPVKRSLQTSFAFALGELLSKKSRVLYLNLESFSGLSKMLQCTFGKDLADLLYHMQNGKEGMIFLLGSMVEKVGGLDILPPMISQMDLISITKSEWIGFLKELENNTEYDYLILDLSDSIQGLFDILRECGKIYTITQNDGFAMAKADQYEKMLKQCHYDDLLGKTKKCEFPKFSYLPSQLEHMGISELAKVVRKIIQEDFEI